MFEPKMQAADLTRYFAGVRVFEVRREAIGLNEYHVYAVDDDMNVLADGVVSVAFDADIIDPEMHMKVEASHEQVCAVADTLLRIKGLCEANLTREGFTPLSITLKAEVERLVNEYSHEVTLTAPEA